MTWLGLLPPGLVHNLDAIVHASDPSAVALECARLDPDHLQLYALLASATLDHRSKSDALSAVERIRRARRALDKLKPDG